MKDIIRSKRSIEVRKRIRGRKIEERVREGIGSSREI
jgi:hypothetical protein